MASAASRCSGNDTGSPARRSSSTNPESRWSTGPRPSGLGGREQLLGRLVDVALVLEQDVETVPGRGGVDGGDPEDDQGAGPVQGLRDRRQLAQVDGPQRAHDPSDLVGQLVGDAGNPVL